MPAHGNLKPGDVAYWRSWWDDTGLKDLPNFGSLLRRGEGAYTKGLLDAESDPPTAPQCQRAIDGWMADMRETMAQAKVEIAARQQK